jgi:probable H4MPT-linked C1 transfer pathway protein
MSDVLGLDIGGAHLKLARVSDGRLLGVRQVACALWQGLDRLEVALAEGQKDWPPAARIAVTMTGELADIFPDRAAGVRAIVDLLTRIVGEAAIEVYSLKDGFVAPGRAKSEPALVASANWHAAARIAAARCANGLFVDIGSTTTDLVPLAEGRVAARAEDDATRLASGELIYTGVVRTPIMAVARHLFFRGARLGVMAEAFASMADVYRLTGALPPHADQHPSADGKGKSLGESRARLARMIGHDAADAPAMAWLVLARQLAARQLALLEEACHRQLSLLAARPEAALIGAGVGRFLVEELARRVGRPYRSFAAMVPAERAVAEAAADCAPAAAVALLAAEARSKAASRATRAGSSGPARVPLASAERKPR